MVVLIIGILAAVALPQYKKVVEKVYLSNAVARVEAIKKQVDLYMLEYGGIPSGSITFIGDPMSDSQEKGELSVDVTAGLSCADVHCYDGRYSYNASGWGGRIDIRASRMVKPESIKDELMAAYGWDKLPYGLQLVSFAPMIHMYFYNGTWKKECNPFLSYSGERNKMALYLCKQLPNDWELSDEF